MKALAKEIFIMALLLMVVVFSLGILFYNCMPNNKTVPTSISYTADASTTTTMQEIAAEKAEANSATNNSDSIMDIGSVIASYSIGSSDLSTYAARKTYESGKVDPFADYQEGTPSEGNENNGQGGNNSNGGSNNNDSTGKLFENKTTK